MFFFYIKIRCLLEKRKILLLLMGNPTSEIRDLEIPYKDFGYIADDNHMAKIYSAAM